MTRRLRRERGKGNMARDGHVTLGPRGEKEHGQVHTRGLSVVEGEVDVRIGPSKCDAITGIRAFEAARVELLTRGEAKLPKLLSFLGDFHPRGLNELENERLDEKGTCPNPSQVGLN